ncbi:hypothetical protein [Halegenticoccus tardaugens]|uniref:hypothetical protein n=1 Tax=Halegenticoccus tardaugens TaxID=2071624 RepID=UPI00100AAD7C|nr:hypothetical protein [Halegenticoccus tardaugens]
MGLISRQYPTVELTDDHLDTPDPQGQLVRIRPYKETDGILDGAEFVRGLWSMQTPTTSSLELWSGPDQIDLIMMVEDPQELRNHVAQIYPGSSVELFEGGPLPAFEPGDYLAGATLGLEEDCALPLKHLETKNALSKDPYRQLLRAIGGEESDRSFVQIAFKPVGKRWYRRGLMGKLMSSTGDDLAHSFRQGELVGEVEPRVVKTDRGRRAAKDIESQAGKAAFETRIRVFSAAPSKRQAAERAEKIVDSFGEYRNMDTYQSFDPDPVGKRRLKLALEAAAWRSVARQHRALRALRGDRQVLTDDELGALCHLPTEAVGGEWIDWKLSKPGSDVPSAIESKIQFD